MARNIFSNWAVLIINIVISFFLAPYVVNKLGNVYYGIWTVVMQFTGYLYLMDFGVRESVVRYTSKFNATGSKKLLNQILSTGLVMYSAVAIACMLIALLGAVLFPYVFATPEEFSAEIRLVVLLVGATIAQTFLFNVFNGILMGVHRFDLGNIVNVLVSFVRLGLVLWVLSSGHKIVALASVQLLVGVITGICMMILAKKELDKLGLAFKFVIKGKKRFLAHARRLFNYSKYVFVINIGQKIIFTTDAILIGLFMPIASVTFYAIAGNLIEYLRNLISATASVLNPLTSHFSAKGEEHKVRELLVNGGRLSLFIGLPVAVVYMVLGQKFIELWMGGQYAETSGEVLFVLALTMALAFPHHTMCMILYGLSKHSVLAFWKVIEALFNIVLSIVLLNYYGLLGVALGTALTHVVVALLILPRIVCKEIQLPLASYWFRVYWRPFVVTIPLVLVALWIQQNLQIDSLWLFFIYVAVLCSFYVGLAFFIVLLPEERQKVVAKLRGVQKNRTTSET